MKVEASKKDSISIMSLEILQEDKDKLLLIKTALNESLEKEIILLRNALASHTTSISDLQITPLDTWQSTTTRQLASLRKLC